MGIIAINEKEKTIKFISSRIGDKSKEYNTYPIGLKLLEFIELDFSRYDEALNEIWTLIKDNSYLEKYYSILIDKTGAISEESLEIAKKRIVERLYIDGIYDKLVMDGNEHRFIEEEVLPKHEYTSNNNILNKNSCHEILALFNYKRIVYMFKKAVFLCLDIDGFASNYDLTSTERYFLVAQTSPSSLPPILQGVIDPTDSRRQPPYWWYCSTHDSRLSDPFIEGNDIKPQVKNVEDLSTEDLERYVTRIKAESPELHIGYNDFSIEKLLTVEFLQMVHLNIRVKKCAYCNKYFILKGKHNATYCSRNYQGTKRTCQQIASSKRLENYTNESKLFKAYDRAYKKNYNMYQRSHGAYNKKDFETWKKKAVAFRNKALLEKMPEQEAILKIEQLKMRQGKR